MFMHATRSLIHRLLALSLLTGLVPVAAQTTVRIRDIQGAGHTSPYNNQTVTGVPGIVTAVRTKGFYIQDPSPDADVATSEGIYVFTNATPTVAVGDAVLISGTVSEYLPTGDTTSLSLTELKNVTITTQSKNNTLPAPIVIGSGGRIPPTTVIDDDNLTAFNATTDGIDFYESLEGMRVQINTPVAVGPTNSYGETPIVGDNGLNASIRTTRGGIVIRSTDFNPERIILGDDIVANPPLVNVGDKFNSSIVGVIDYSSSNFKLLNTSALPTVTSGGIAKEATTLTGSSTQLIVSTLNVENLDPSDTARFGDLANIVVNNLKNPDILNLEEIQDNNGATNDTVVDAATTINTLINAIATAGGPTYQYRQINPVDDQDGGEPGGNIRVVFLYNPARVSFVDRAGGTSTAATTVNNVGGKPQLSFSPGRVDPTNAAFASSRKPLVGEFQFNGQTVFVIGNHFNSKGGDNPLYGKTQPPVLSSATQRLQQAQIVNGFVNSLLAIDSSAKVVVLGDLNDFEFSAPLTTLKGSVLTALVETLPQAERYSYVYEGNSQAIDHILVSNNLVSGATYDIVHVNSEFATQVSDHDPALVRLTINNAVAAPTLSSFSPASGPVGTAVTITGTNFTGATTVKFNNVTATFTVNSATSITATVPTGATTGTVSVTTAGGTAISSTSFTITTSTGPVNNNLSNATTISGATATVTGSNVNATKETGEPNHAGNAGGKSVWWNWTAPNANSVTIETTGSPFDTLLGVYTGTVVSALTTIASNDDATTAVTTSKVTFTPVAGTTYRIAVDGYNGALGNITLKVTQTATAATPTISSFSPSSGPVGTSVTITGTNFTGATAVKFNGVSATTFGVTSTSITVTVPTGATSGAISVTTPGGTATSSGTFTVTTTGSSQLLLNPGFENGTTIAPWVSTTGVIDNSASPAAHSGSWKAYLNGYGTTHTDTLYQTVTIPSTATTVTLDFYLLINSAETTTTTAYDTLKVQVRNGGGTVLTTLATYSNLNTSTGYVQKTFNLAAYKGQTVQIYFEGKEDSSQQTSFLIDDTSLTVQ